MFIFSVVYFFFFFSSRRRHTRCLSDWSSDVCSSDLEMIASDVLLTNSAGIHAIPIAEFIVAGVLHFLRGFDIVIDQQRRTEWNKQRSEERRVGKERR